MGSGSEVNQSDTRSGNVPQDVYERSAKMGADTRSGNATQSAYIRSAKMETDIRSGKAKKLKKAKVKIPGAQAISAESKINGAQVTKTKFMGDAVITPQHHGEPMNHFHFHILGTPAETTFTNVTGFGNCGPQHSLNHEFKL